MKTTELLIDSYGRRITTLRISLTEHCNFRCTYCTPLQGLHGQSASRYLTSHEIARLVRIIGRLGVGRIRLTGGEPLLRGDLIKIVRSLKQIPTVKDLSITTNGSRLAGLIYPLKEAGLDRINISLDSLDPERFRRVTRSNDFEKVYRAVYLTLMAGIPIKLNMVALKGLAPDEILQFVELAVDHPLEVRFLEFMPLCGDEWEPEKVLPIQNIRAIVREHFDLVELPCREGVARVFQISGGRGRVGFIASLTESFCHRCSRFRISADGDLFPCLFSHVKVSVKQLLREGAGDQKITQAIQLAARLKPKGNGFQEDPFTTESGGAFAKEATPLIRKIGG